MNKKVLPLADKKDIDCCCTHISGGRCKDMVPPKDLECMHTEWLKRTEWVLRNDDSALYLKEKLRRCPNPSNIKDI